MMREIWGPIRAFRAREVVFAPLLPRQRVAPSMVVPNRRVCWLAQEGVLVGTDCTQPGHGTDGGTGHMGMY